MRDRFRTAYLQRLLCGDELGRRSCADPLLPFAMRRTALSIQSGACEFRLNEADVGGHLDPTANGR